MKSERLISVLLLPETINSWAQQVNRTRLILVLMGLIILSNTLQAYVKAKPYCTIKTNGIFDAKATLEKSSLSGIIFVTNDAKEKSVHPPIKNNNKTDIINPIPTGFSCVISFVNSLSDYHNNNCRTVSHSFSPQFRPTMNVPSPQENKNPNVSFYEANTQTFHPSSAKNPRILNFTNPTNGSNFQVTATFSTTTTCTATQNLAIPTNDYLLTSLISGNIGGMVWRDFNMDTCQDVLATIVTRSS